MSNHSFDADIAIRVGIAPAVMYQNISWWIAKNKANNENFVDGHFWTYNSVKAFAELFPYLTEDQVRRALEKLISSGLIVAGNHNKAGYDRTKWFRLSCQFHLAELPNGSGKIAKPIPVINTNINTDSFLSPIVPRNEIQEFDFDQGQNETREVTVSQTKPKSEIITPALATFDDCRKRLSPTGKTRITVAKAWTLWQGLVKANGEAAVVSAFEFWNTQELRNQTGAYQPDMARWLRDKAQNIIDLNQDGSLDQHHHQANGNPIQNINGQSQRRGMSIHEYLVADLARMEHEDSLGENYDD